MVEIKTSDFLTDNEIDLRLEKKLVMQNVQDQLTTYSYGIFLHNFNDKIGYINFSVGDDENTKYEGNLNIKFENQLMDKSYGSNAYALINRLALQHNMSEIIITCDPENYDLRKKCDELGGKLLGILSVPKENKLYKDGHKQRCIYKWVLKDYEPCFEKVKLIYSKLPL